MDDIAATGRLRLSRHRWRRLAGCAALVLLLAAAPTVWERLVAAPHLRDPATVPVTPVALVFGARVDDDAPTAFLASRLDQAVRLLAAGKVRTILVSGNNDGHGYDEPDAMRAYLLAHGVPADRITVDEAGFTTWDTCVRARTVFGVRTATLVTQTFHVWRAVTLCRAAGVTGYGVGVDSASVGLGSTGYGYFREFFAADKALWTVLTN
ncbi:MAG TPA: ElyC/SanA/YdcF family protein [Pseudonocardiaceae bacterium]|nr:ElyC/SanA/YdcF family protein [Pseudonocardiaceae bacterium]